MDVYKYLPIVLFTFIISCSEKPSTAKQPEQAKSTGEIVNTYVNTLTTAKDKANAAVGATNARTDVDSKAAQEMDKQ